MEMSLLRSSSFGSALKPDQSATSHRERVMILKATGKFTTISSKYSLVIHSTKLYCRQSSKLFFQEKVTPIQSYVRKPIPLIRAYTQLGGDKFADSPLKKVIKFSDLVMRFARGYIVRGSVIGFAGVVVRMWMENAHVLKLSKWSLAMRLTAALIALICSDGYIGGINQISDLEIDKINKPYLPIASGELTLRSAWLLTIGFIAIGILMTRLLNSTSFLGCLCFEFFLGSLYSIPPFITKRSTIGAILTCASMRGYGFALLMTSAARATLGLQFHWSLPVAFLSIFGTLFYLAIGAMKDISDLEGDTEGNVPTLASIIGARKVALLGFGLIVSAYVSAISAAICMPQVFRRSVMIPAHVLLALCFVRQAWKLANANYSKEESKAFYQLMWKLYDIEYIIFPFI